MTIKIRPTFLEIAIALLITIIVITAAFLALSDWVIPPAPKPEYVTKQEMRNYVHDKVTEKGDQE